MACAVCGKEFEKKWGRVKYCSPECYHKANKQISKDRYYDKTKAPKKAKHICRWCGKTKVEGYYERCHYCNQSMYRQGYNGLSKEESYIG
jgi:hypothetical protein